MRTFTTAVAGVALTLSMFVGIAQAASLTNDQVTAIMNLLQSFGADQSVITNVQTSLTGGKPTGMGGGEHHDAMGSTTRPMGDKQGDKKPMGCIMLARNLSQGSQGEDVKSFQMMLKDEGHFMGSTTGFFGAMTAKAVAEWQEKNGIASSTKGGMIGMMTRKFLEHRCAPGMGIGSTTQH